MQNVPKTYFLLHTHHSLTLFICELIYFPCISTFCAGGTGDVMSASLVMKAACHHKVFFLYLLFHYSLS